MKILENVEAYKVCEPLFEGIRVIMTYLGEGYSPQYIQGISGAAFRVATGCPSRPTCCFLMWTPDLIKLLGYEYKEYPCTGSNDENLMDEMIAAVRAQVDAGRPALVWHAMTNAEWDVVSGYDEEKGLFYGRGSYKGFEGSDYHNEPWDRAAKAVEICPAFGAVTIGAKTGTFDARKAEVAALRDAVAHARTVKEKPEAGGWYSYEGIQSLRKWSEAFSNPGKDRDAADAYCFQVYHSTHGTAAGFLREIAPHYVGAAGELLQEAAGIMQEEASTFARCAPFLWWDSPWGVDEERSRMVAPLLRETADLYEKAVESLEKALTYIG
jgi:hypothetical protein